MLKSVKVGVHYSSWWGEVEWRKAPWSVRMQRMLQGQRANWYSGGNSLQEQYTICDTELRQEKMRGPRGKLRALAGICHVHESYF